MAASARLDAPSFDALDRVMRQRPSSFAVSVASRTTIDRVNRETSERNRARRQGLALVALADPRD